MTIRKADQERLAALAAAAESATELPAGDGYTHLTGEAARAEGNRMLLEALGSPAAIEKEIRRGRPPLGASVPAGSSAPTIRARIDPDRESRLQAIERATNKNRSLLLREAVDLLLSAYEEPKASPFVVVAEFEQAQTDLLQSLGHMQAITGRLHSDSFAGTKKAAAPVR